MICIPSGLIMNIATTAKFVFGDPSLHRSTPKNSSSLSTFVQSRGPSTTLTFRWDIFHSQSYPLTSHTVCTSSPPSRGIAPRASTYKK